MVRSPTFSKSAESDYSETERRLFQKSHPHLRSARKVELRLPVTASDIYFQHENRKIFFSRTCARTFFDNLRSGSLQNRGSRIVVGDVLKGVVMAVYWSESIASFFRHRFHRTLDDENAKHCLTFVQERLGVLTEGQSGHREQLKSDHETIIKTISGSAESLDVSQKSHHGPHTASSHQYQFERQNKLIARGSETAR
ncbi:hypothetical protein P8C59_005892 [Phyllachora maydis]|uniref:Uncharacterized protein n=1 Tax=Phyllachora maydis TaxID=1825666 RepID=A0AAD9I6F7_9PEZI|nr:hypothetical protein P8C59_005892 [Phyllachora maydis]